MTQWVRDVDSLYDFIGYVIVHAPDSFPREDYLTDSEQMDLLRAFAELRRGAHFATADGRASHSESALAAVLDRAMTAYRAGDYTAGAHSVHEFQTMIFKD